MSKWIFDYNPQRRRWEAYKTPIDWGDNYKQLWEIFGPPRSTTGSRTDSNWDYVGGWLYIYSDEALTLLKLKWH